MEMQKWSSRLCGPLSRDGRFDLRVLLLGQRRAALLLDRARRCAGWDFELAVRLRLRSGGPAEPDYRRVSLRS
jgi:hypothetical protein